MRCIAATERDAVCHGDTRNIPFERSTSMHRISFRRYTARSRHLDLSCNNSYYYACNVVATSTVSRCTVLRRRFLGVSYTVRVWQCPGQKSALACHLLHTAHDGRLLTISLYQSLGKRFGGTCARVPVAFLTCDDWAVAHGLIGPSGDHQGSVALPEHRAGACRRELREVVRMVWTEGLVVVRPARGLATEWNDTIPSSLLGLCLYEHPRSRLFSTQLPM